ncbi:DUF2322 family protein [Curvibacter sp. APW13]|uniref:DUF2322 family protein n=1 Tax=Curvibacter sp. APW13 TaxID=3077236 RepID=UPI0028E062F6|nr:DUF2322 family protein [Curvibacter sp. APW13]MDT8991504.1 DUF2322 family protein [Curvibacter sp. APW13]
MNFADTLKTLPTADHIAAIELHDATGTTVARLENKPGSAGSVRVYAALTAEFGSISPEAAQRGLALYCEHTDDARQHPGKHPNIDRLLALTNGGEPLQARLLPQIEA